MITNAPGAMIHYGRRLTSPTPERGTIQRWNTPGYRHCQETDQQGNTRTWISKEPTWDWIETTHWQTPAAKEQR